jgi:hypothetical protein
MNNIMLFIALGVFIIVVCAIIAMFFDDIFDWCEEVIDNFDSRKLSIALLNLEAEFTLIESDHEQAWNTNKQKSL